VTGGGVSDDGQHWNPARNGFLVPFAALAKLVRGKLRAALARRRPDLVLPEATWSKRWVVHCTAWGEGDEAVLRYLARYVFRIAITNNRIVGLDDNSVTIRHKHRASNRWRTTRLSGHELMRRFLQHVLPKGLHKVRYYGLWHPTRRDHAARARLLLMLQRSTDPGPSAPSPETTGDTADRTGDRPCDERRVCPFCKEGHLTHMRRLYPKQASGP
jgi:Putative transposase